MLSISSHEYLSQCPSCQHDNEIFTAVKFLGIHVVAEYICGKCACLYSQDLPVGHALYYPIQKDITNNKITDPYKVSFFTSAFARSLNHPDEQKVSFSRIVKEEKQEVIIVNCLDYLYGHVLLKLLNVSYYKETNPDKGVIVLVPASFTWLVPDYVCEIWEVKEKLSRFKNVIPNLDEFIQPIINSSFQKVWLGATYPHPYTEKARIEEYVKVAPFDFSKFSEVKPTFTFIYRTDRLWFGSKLEYLLFLVLRKLNWIKSFSFLFPGLQNSRVQKLAKHIKNSIPDMDFLVIGLGKKGSLGKHIQDLRKEQLTEEDEKYWASCYAKSHVVIGIHGSNMLLPSALSASVVELLPFDRTGNLTQDIITNKAGRDVLFLNRMVPEYFSPKQVASQVEAIYKGWPLFHYYNNPENHVYSEQKASFWKNFSSKVLLLRK
jgi:hypothetical protein